MPVMKIRALAPILLLVGLPAACSPSGEVVGFGGASLLRHRIAGAREVAAAPGVGRAGIVDVSVDISPEGRVVAARADPEGRDERANAAAALAAARRWTFRPFFYAGEPVLARGTIEMRYAPPERWRDPRAPFPPIDYDDLKIVLARGGCFGRCPIYSVTIDGAGAVEFDTPDGATRRWDWQAVLIPGKHRARIDRATLDALVDRFRAARFFGLAAKYDAQIPDSPGYVLTFRTGGREWTVLDHVGRDMGMPAVVTELQDAVDAAAGTARWVHGTEETLAALAEEGFDFRSPAAAALALAATQREAASDEFFLGMIGAGLPLDSAAPVPDGSARTLGGDDASCRGAPGAGDFVRGACPARVDRAFRPRHALRGLRRLGRRLQCGDCERACWGGTQPRQPFSPRARRCPRRRCDSADVRVRI